MSMIYRQQSAAEIDRKLREEFAHRLRDYGFAEDTVDPALAVLFRTLGGEIEKIYKETERIRLLLLDELIDGLGMPHRMARPAQTVVRFHAQHETVLIEAGTDLLGEAESGERLTFTTLAGIVASSAGLSFAAAYSDGLIRMISGITPSEPVQAARPSREPARADLGPNPAIYLAFEGLSPQHLSRHGLFFDVSPYAAQLQRALLTEPWCLARADGFFSGEGIMRPVRANAGHRELRWLNSSVGPDGRGQEIASVPGLPDGFYSGRMFRLPVIVEPRRFMCAVPRGMEESLGKLLGDTQVLEQPRAWIRIGLPTTVSDIDQSLVNILLHSTIASNLECFNETIYFGRHGTSIPVSREEGALQYLVAPVSIWGESGLAYISDATPSPDAGAGRYSIRSGRLHLQPSRYSDGRQDQYANVRLWLTSGVAGNTVSLGQVHSFLHRADRLPVEITNPTSSAGGTDGERYSDAYARFSEVLLSRQRIVTRDDLTSAVRSFDRRILSPAVSMTLRRAEGGVQRTHIVRATLNPADFTDFEQESRVLEEELTNYLKQHALFDEPVSVEFEVAV